MVNEETIYTGNTQQNPNEGVLKNIVDKAWKPVTIGGSTGILLGAGALLAQHTIAISADAKPVAHPTASHSDAAHKAPTFPLEEQVLPTQDTPQDVPQDNSQDDIISMSAHSNLRVAVVSDDMTFEEAFADARAQVGPGGVFYWHDAIFSTYIVEEWEAMSEEERDAFADLVRPEIDANHVDAARFAVMDDIEPDSDIDSEGGDVYAHAGVEHTLDADQDVADIPVYEVKDDFILADIHEAEGGFALADDDVVVADNDEVIQDIAMVDEDQDIAVAETDAEADFALDEMFDLKAEEDLAMAEGSKSSPDSAHRDSFENFISDDVVRIVGYGEFDGHMVRGLDLDGDNIADVAVIDVDDSGDLSRDDIVVEDGNGNMSTYGDLHDFAMNQLNEHHDDLHDTMTNPDVAADMPDYMDDAIAQL